MSGSLPLLLLVDDEPEILVALGDLLEDRYRILSTASPVEALELVRTHPDIAVIVSDQRMPELTGSQFLARVRSQTNAEAILLTGYADLTAVVTALNDGAISGYANKPWDAEALIAMIAAAADRFALRQALAFERAAFRALADGSGDIVTILDRDGQVVRGTAQPKGVDPRDLAIVGQDDSDSEDRQSPQPSGDRWTHITRIPFAIGTQRYLLKIERDDTDRRLSERRHHQSEKLEALGTLSGGIAHDFNNLLAAIIGNLELAERRIDDRDRLRRYLGAATEAAGRGSAITRRLLSFSRQRDLAAEIFRPDDVIQSIEELIVRTAAGRIRVAYDFAEPAWVVRTDVGQFELAILNLAINARDAMEGSGTVRIGTANIADAAVFLPDFAGPFVRISVSDTGSGMDSAVRERVFEPFFTTKAQGAGTGLGLPMVRAMARAAGGDVTIDSEVGRGTSIHLWLPRIDAGPIAVSPPASDRITPRRLMLVEDDPEVRAVVAAQLEAAGHSVVVHDSATRAVAVLEAGERFDMVLTDYAMPDMSGIDVAARVRACCPDTPVLLITGFAEIGDTQIGVPVLTKPFTSDQLLSAIALATAIPDNVSG
ncbi:MULTISPECIES: response regulator [unclassified Sphingomonas]|uniref:response regulator n=1 Tax=unclassified Sphingomonas TaxID=196159 RepID=UPI00138F927A|nr:MULTISPECIES: response regulator [unclassified Sphingomonas]